jgi:hypothetical protein
MYMGTVNIFLGGCYIRAKGPRNEDFTLRPATWINNGPLLA